MTSTTSPKTCYRHADRETNLRCTRCDKYICASCAVRTPTGYRCPDCIKEQKKVYDTALLQDYVLAFLVAGVLSFIASLIVQYIGFFIVFIAPTAGIIIAEAVRKVVSRRRSKTLFQVATLAVVLGGAILMLDDLFFFFFMQEPIYLVGMIWPGIYIVFAAGSTYARLSGIQFSR